MTFGRAAFALRLAAGYGLNEKKGLFCSRQKTAAKLSSASGKVVSWETGKTRDFAVFANKDQLRSVFADFLPKLCLTPSVIRRVSIKSRIRIFESQ